MKKQEILFFSIFPALFLMFIYFVTLDNFYIWDDFIWFLAGQENIDNFFIYAFSLNVSTYTPLYDNFIFNLYKLFGVSNPSFWYLTIAFLHCMNFFLVYKLLRFYFPKPSVFHFLVALIFLFSSVFHENLFFITASAHLLAAVFVFSSFLFYLYTFDSKKRRKWAFLSLLFMIFAFLSKESSILLIAYIFLDTLFFHLKQVQQNQRFYLVFYFSLIVFVSVYFFKPSKEMHNLPDSLRLISFTPISIIFLNLYHSFFTLFNTVFTSLPIWFKIPFSFAFLSLILFFIFQKIHLKKLLFSLLCLFVSLLPFLSLSLYASKLLNRYFYFSGFFFMFFLFIFFDFLASHLKWKKLTLSLAIIFIPFHAGLLVIANQLIYLPLGQAAQEFILTQKPFVVQEYQFLGFSFENNFNSRFTDPIPKYLKNQKKMLSKYHFNLK